MQTSCEDKCNLCLEIIGPLQSKFNNSCNKTTGIYYMNYIDNSSNEMIIDLKEGYKLVDRLTDIKTDQFKKTHNTEKFKILSMFNKYVEDEQPIESGTYLISKILICDLEHKNDIYSKPITFFVECINNKLFVLHKKCNNINLI